MTLTTDPNDMERLLVIWVMGYDAANPTASATRDRGCDFPALDRCMYSGVSISLSNTTICIDSIFREVNPQVVKLEDALEPAPHRALWHAQHPSSGPHVAPCGL